MSCAWGNGESNAPNSKFRVSFTFEARNEREVMMLISQPDLLKEEAEMRIENISRKWDLRMAALIAPFVVAMVLIGIGLAKAIFGE